MPTFLLHFWMFQSRFTFLIYFTVLFLKKEIKFYYIKFRKSKNAPLLGFLAHCARFENRCAREGQNAPLSRKITTSGHTATTVRCERFVWPDFWTQKNAKRGQKVHSWARKKIICAKNPLKKRKYQKRQKSTFYWISFTKTFKNVGFAKLFWKKIGVWKIKTAEEKEKYLRKVKCDQSTVVGNTKLR